MMRTAWGRAWLVLGLCIFTMLLVWLRTTANPPQCGIVLHGDLTWEPIDNHSQLKPGCQFTYQP